MCPAVKVEAHKVRRGFQSEPEHPAQHKSLGVLLLTSVVHSGVDHSSAISDLREGNQWVLLPGQIC